MALGTPFANLTEAIAEGEARASLITRLHGLEATRLSLEKDALALHPIPRLAPAVIENRLAE